MSNKEEIKKGYQAAKERIRDETPPAPVPGKLSGQPATDERQNEPDNKAANTLARDVPALNKAPHKPPYEGESAWHKRQSDHINEGKDHMNPTTPPVSGNNQRNVPVGHRDQDAPRSKRENDEIEAENARQAEAGENPDGTINVEVTKEAPRDTILTTVAEKKEKPKRNLLPVRLLKGYYPLDGSKKAERGSIRELPADEARDIVAKGIGERGDAF